LLEENTTDNFNIYPNPSSSTITINLTNKLMNQTLCIYDVSGQKIHQQKIVSNTENINVSKFSKGIYLIEIGNSKQKFVVE
jgi:chitinase